MPASTDVVQKKTGRPSINAGGVTAIRLPPELRAAIDDWREAQPDKPSRSEAMRRLLAVALADKPQP